MSEAAASLLFLVWLGHIRTAESMLRIGNFGMARAELESAREVISQIESLSLTPGFCLVHDSATPLPTVSTVSTIDV